MKDPQSPILPDCIHSPVLFVALTGGIAAGKSIIADIWKNLGCYLYSADNAAHELMRPQTQVWQKIIDHFGNSILNQDQTIDRKKLGAIVFSEKNERLVLNRIVHPEVLNHKNKQILKMIKSGKHNIFVSDAALTIEAGHVDFYDKVVVVSCTDKQQLTRLMNRDRIDKQEAQKRIDSQLSQKEKSGRADYIIKSSSSLLSTIEQAERTYRHLQMDQKTKSLSLNI